MLSVSLIADEGANVQFNMWPFKFEPPVEEVVGSSPSKQTAPIDNEPLEQQAVQVKPSTSLIQHRKARLDRQQWTGCSDERLGIIFSLRSLLLMGVSFLSGASLGAARGSSVAADRYRAENAHRLPTNQNGWFLYHKSKNYHSILGGMKEGARFGTILTGWAFMFMVTEEVVDQSRARIFAGRDDERATGQRDTASTVISAMTVAGIYSWKQGFDQFAAARTAKMALKYSLIYGLVQDALATLRGSRPAYVDWIARKTSRSALNDMTM